MMAEGTTQNPMIVIPSISAPISMNGISDNDTMAEKIKNLTTEIETGIMNMQRGSSEEKQQQLEAIRHEAHQMRSSDIVYIHLLFRKYADAANEMVEVLRDNAMFSSEGAVGFIFEPKDEKRLVGLKALQTNIFWLRMIAAILSFISYVVMSTVRYITENQYHPADFFELDCAYLDLKGYFDMRPYQMIIAVGVIVYIYSLLLAFYYLLPVNERNNKFIPGCTRILNYCVDDPYRSEDISNRVFIICKSLSRFAEMLFDGLVALLAFVAFLIAAIWLERSSRFEIGKEEQYYSLGSLYATYTHTNPSCLEYDITPNIRAGLAMFFFMMIAMSICFQVSYRSFMDDIKKKPPLAAGMTGLPDQDFRHLPVDTHSDMERDEESGMSSENIRSVNTLNGRIDAVDVRITNDSFRDDDEKNMQIANANTLEGDKSFTLHGEDFDDSVDEVQL